MPKAKTPAQRTKDYESKLKADGFVRFVAWVRPEQKERIRKYVKRVNAE